VPFFRCAPWNRCDGLLDICEREIVDSPNGTEQGGRRARVCELTERNVTRGCH
jgi:hypothetical protein